jgi:hypothetical protein
MEKHLIALKLCLIGCFSVAGCVGAYAQSAAELPGGCSVRISIQKADEFVDGQMLEYGKRSEAVLADVQSIKSRAQSPDVIVPGVPQGELLSKDDIDKVNDLWRKLASISAEENVVNNYKRDVQVIAETYRVAKLADLYEVKKEDLGDADPRRFYFVILERLRVSQPHTPRTPQIGQENNCDPEAGLFFEEEFNRQQLAKSHGDPRWANLIFDMERLRTLYDLCRNLLAKGITDVRATMSSGDANSPRSIESYIAASDAAIQSMYSTIVPYIDQQFPSDWSFEQDYLLKKEQVGGKK